MTLAITLMSCTTCAVMRVHPIRDRIQVPMEHLEIRVHSLVFSFGAVKPTAAFTETTNGPPIADAAPSVVLGWRFRSAAAGPTSGFSLPADFGFDLLHGGSSGAVRRRPCRFIHKIGKNLPFRPRYNRNSP